MGALHCTLFLFNDRLIIVKRPNAQSSGRALSGLNEIDKLIRTNAIRNRKKSTLSMKGVIDVVELAATDVGGSEFHIYLESPPQDQTDRWSGRPFRSLQVVLPPSANLDPTLLLQAKNRFLENLWRAQALYRAESGKCATLRSQELDVENHAGRLTKATAFYNIYERKSYLTEAKKV